MEIKGVDLTGVAAPRNRIDLIGIELEGGWDDAKFEPMIVRDGSVKFAQTQDDLAREAEQAVMQDFQAWRRRTRDQAVQDRGPTAPLNWEGEQAEYQRMIAEWLLAHPPRTGPRPRLIGELPSNPLAVEKIEDSKEAFWKEWIIKHYPPYVNETCGMHVHVSFKSPLTYQRLMDRRLIPTTIEVLTKWAQAQGLSSDHPLWDRLAGKSVYCQPIFHADAQAKRTRKEYDHHAPGHRYTIWNFNYAIHKTAECRILPMMDSVQVAISAIEEIISLVNRFLLATAAREKKVRLDLPLEVNESDRMVLSEMV